jgi:diacylglycerol kinase
MPRPESTLSWPKKFSVAFRGLLWAIRSQSSFWVHIPIAIAVLIVAGIVHVELWRWVTLVLTITIVFTAELLNSAIEQIIRVLHPEYDERIGRALDISAAGVLAAAIGAIVIGVLTLAQPIWIAASKALQ